MSWWKPKGRDVIRTMWHSFSSGDPCRQTQTPLKAFVKRAVKEKFHPERNLKYYNPDFNHDITQKKWAVCFIFPASVCSCVTALLKNFWMRPKRKNKAANHGMQIYLFFFQGFSNWFIASILSWNYFAVSVKWIVCYCCNSNRRTPPVSAIVLQPI